MIVNDGILQDYEGNLFYLQTSKNRISGIYYPEEFIENKSDYQYFNVFNIKYDCSPPDTGYINENFIISLINKDSNDNSIISYSIHLEAIIKENTLDKNSIGFTFQQMNCNSNIMNCAINNRKSFLQSWIDEEEIINEEGNKELLLRMWVNVKGVEYICVQRKTSLSESSKFDNVDQNNMIKSGYDIEYINKNNLEIENHLVNVLDFSNIITNITDINSDIWNKISNIQLTLDTNLPQFNYCSILYDKTYYPEDINTDEVVLATDIRSLNYMSSNYSKSTLNSVNIPVTLLPENIGQYAQPNNDGMYQLQLKPNIKILNGKTDVEISLYINDFKLDDTSTTLHLDVTNQPQIEGFCSGSVTLFLSKTDKIYLKYRWTDKNIDIINNTVLQINQLSIISE